MQLAVAYAALANYGKVMKPRIVKGIKNEETGEITWLQPKDLGNAVSPLTASKIRNMLVSAVEEGTGKRAKLDGVKVAGKTGTATKVVNGRYDPTRVVVSFYGFFPADSPKWVIGIVLDEPTYGKWGGEVAAPLFAALGQQILWRVQPPRPLSLTQDLTALSFFATSPNNSQRQ
jgi:cell division protein FtsI/penicillin-binding protein 2